MNTDKFVEYMQKRAEEPAPVYDGFDEDTIKAGQGIFTPGKPTSSDALGGIYNEYITRPDTAPSKQQIQANNKLTSSSDAGLSMDQLRAKRSWVNAVGQPIRAHANVSATTPMQTDYRKAVPGRIATYLGEKPGGDYNWDDLWAMLSGRTDAKAKSMKAMMLHVKANPSGPVAQRLGLGRSQAISEWGGPLMKGITGGLGIGGVRTSPVQDKINSEVVNAAVQGTANLPGDVKKAQQAALGKFWANNKEWLTAAGVGIGGLGLLLTLLLTGGGGRQQQQAGNQPKAPWWANKNWSGYNYRNRV